ncbi:aspartyl/asparaginyl beta-hydroxylase domain-containing protein [Sphingomonas sp.]|uniref:aspartyl/asparaginyl beta-hydroxylase domain-containing protein n=1 Tax=Sphingomonas sp. TaxID=28214 RepID=UPI002CC20711|nr:aspartyl/asparaginyl beta-hydroxylase domain-containing protein [Sphingomonas sp.]HWK36934.1 aspartyl/asparaginyl beta-hydroxylase domain-containing protein [Sphingomonas sp.]
MTLFADPAPEWRFPDRVALPFTFDAAALDADLNRIEAREWTRHVVRENYDGRWDMLPLRAPAGETHPIRLVYPDPGATAFVDTALLDDAPAFRAVLDSFRCPLRVVRLMRLAAGSRILEHSDVRLDAESGMARLHVPIRTNADVRFLLNGVPVTMTPGSCWYLRLSDPHAVTNDGASDRVHLVIDVDVNAWLLRMLEAPFRSP